MLPKWWVHSCFTMAEAVKHHQLNKQDYLGVSSPKEIFSIPSPSSIFKASKRSPWLFLQKTNTKKSAKFPPRFRGFCERMLALSRLGLLDGLEWGLLLGWSPHDLDMTWFLGSPPYKPGMPAWELLAHRERWDELIPKVRSRAWHYIKPWKKKGPWLFRKGWRDTTQSIWGLLFHKP